MKDNVFFCYYSKYCKSLIMTDDKIIFKFREN
jgi:hypothetical protein